MVESTLCFTLREVITILAVISYVTSSCVKKRKGDKKPKRKRTKK